MIKISSAKCIYTLNIGIAYALKINESFVLTFRKSTPKAATFSALLTHMVFQISGVVIKMLKF